jgi:hypothetical protein
MMMMGGKAPWYLSGGIAKPNCVAAYQSKGAANYAASKINLVTPGTYDLTDGVAFPTWDATNGWYFTALSLQYLTIASAIIPATPLSMVCRFLSSNADLLMYLMSICQSGGNASAFAIAANGAAAGDPIVAETVNSPTDIVAASTAGFTALTKYTATAVYSAIDARAAFINGTNKGTDVTSVTPGGLNATYLGVFNIGADLLCYLDGQINSCAFYNIALSDSQVLALHTAMAAL